jgi:ribosomal protein S18 acetylase RimI-like enzyme
MNIIPISHLPLEALPALADLHAATMPTLLTELGRDFILRYYYLAQIDSAVIALVVINNSTTEHALRTKHYAPIGYVLGSSNPSSLNARLRSPFPWFAAQMLKLAFSRPGVLLQLAQSVLTASEANSLKPGQIELTYIGVAPQARGQGLGKTILAAFVESAHAAGYTSVALSVETDNPAAIALYTKFGFTITQTFREGRYHRHRMEYSLTP